jgi:hypothetical protein
MLAAVAVMAVVISLAVLLKDANAVLWPKLVPKLMVPLAEAAIKVSALLPSTLPLKLMTPPWFCVTTMDPLAPLLKVVLLELVLTALGVPV